jgi:hypothetical protein
MILLNPVLKKLRIESLAVPYRGVFFKTSLFVKWNNTKFPNVSSRTSHLMYSTHFTLSCRVLLALPTSNTLSSLYLLKSPKVSLAVLLSHPGVHCFSGHCNVLDLGSAGPWTSDMEDLPNPMQEDLVLLFGLCFMFHSQKMD